MDHLVDVHGIRRIAFLKGPEINHEAKARFAAYREALASRGLEEDPSLWIQGDFTRAGAVRALSAHCRGQAKPDFQAVLAANDEMAIGALEALREHGCSVPRDVAIVGFDNIQDAQFVLPSLTTVGQLLIDQGRTAAELAARLARGEAAPPVVVLPARLVLRTSCGCLPRSVAALDSLPPRARRTGSRAVDAGRVIAQLESQFPPPPPDLSMDAVRRSLEMLAKNAGTKAFLDTFQEILNGEVASGNHITAWQPLLTGLQRELASAAESPRRRALLQEYFQKAQALLAEMLRLEQGKAFSELQGHLSQLRRVTERLASVASMEQLMDDLARELDLLDISTCFIACYPEEKRHLRGDAWVVPDRAEAALALVDGERVGAAGAGRSFSPADRFVPARYLPPEKRYTLITTALFFREDQIGYIAFEPGKRDWAIYETFCVQLCSLLNSSLLFIARQRVLDALEREHALVAVLMDTLPDRIYFKDERSRFVLINASMAQALGVGEPVEAVGKTDFDYFTPEHAQPAYDAEQEIMRTGEPLVDIEEQETWPDGRSTWVSTTKMPLRDGQGRIIGTFGVSRDNSERRHSEARLIQAQRLESLAILAGGIAHQFNNSNAVIKGYLDALLDSPGISVLVRSYGEEALKGVERLVDITERLQGLTGSAEPGGGSCRLNLLAGSLLHTFEKKIDERRVSVDLLLQETPPVPIHSSRVGFIFSSLLDNALDAMIERPVRTLTIRTGAVDASVFLEIRDTGCGIPAEEIPRLFTPFFTTKGEWAPSNSPQARVRGVGLSLSVCRSTVSESGGRIEVESVPDVGTTFRVWLPIAG
jgi:PAS domain S-box-containing protein